MEINPLIRQVHARPCLQTFNEPLDNVFLSRILSLDGVVDARFLNKHTVTVVVDDLYVEDWPAIEKKVFGLIDEHAQWTASRVKVRRRLSAVEGSREIKPSFVRLAPRSQFDQVIRMASAETVAATEGR